MPSLYNNYWKHFLRALLWLTGVASFAIAPVIFLQFIGWLSEEDVTRRELAAVNNIRYVVFVCCSVTGSVLFMYRGAGFRNSSVIGNVAIYIAPLLMLLYIFLKYLLVYVQLDDVHDFGPGNTGTRLTIIFSVIYCLLTRTVHNIKAEHARR